MKKLLLFLAIGGGIYYAQTHYFPQLGAGKGAFDEQGNVEIIVFTFDGCGLPCKDATSALKRSKQPIKSVTVSPNSDSETIMRSYGLSTRQFPGIAIGDEKIQGFDARKIRSALLKHYGTDVLTGTERRIFKSHFNADGSPKFIFYSASWCGYCKRLREHLTSNSIPFTELDVEKNSRAMGYFKALGGTGYPLAYIGYNQVDGGHLGRVDQAIEELMKL